MKHYDNLEPIFFTPPPVRGRYVNGLHKGGSAPKPDPQIGKAALETAQLGRDMFAFYQQEYINNKPAQDKLNALAAQVQEQLVESGKLNNQIAKDYYDYMIDVFRPLEKDLVKSANEYDTAGRREAEAAEGLSDVRQAFDTQRDMANRNKERMGVNPNSGNSMALNAQMDVQEAIAGADAMNKGRERAESMGRAMKLDAVSIGKGLPANQATSQQIANSSATGALNAGLADAQNNRAALDVMGKGYQGAITGVGNSANILQNQYNSQLQAWQANNARSDAAWGGIGNLAGMAVGAMFADGGLVDAEEIAQEGGNVIDNETGEVFTGEGAVSGPGTTTSDSIPARLSDKEYVLNAEATAMIGLDELDEWNKRGLMIRQGGK